MFEPQAQTFIALKDQRIISLYQSVNEPRISPQPDVSAEPAQCSFFVLEADQDRMMIAIGLFFPQSEYRILYKTQAFAAEELAERISMAEAFAGEMGFMMRDRHISAASARDLELIKKQIVFFHREVKDFLKVNADLSHSSVNAESSTSSSSSSIDPKFLELYAKMASML